MCRLSKLDIRLRCRSSAMFAGNLPLFTPRSLLLCQRPVNKTLCLFEDEREKRKNKNKHKKHIHSTHFLIRHLCFTSGELFFRALWNAWSQFITSQLAFQELLLPLGGASFGGYSVHLLLHHRNFAYANFIRRNLCLFLFCAGDTLMQSLLAYYAN